MPTHVVEPELLQPLPRRTQLRGGLGQGCGMWFGRLFCLPHLTAGVWLIFMASCETIASIGRCYVEDEVVGVVVSKHEYKPRSPEKRPHYQVDFVYEYRSTRHRSTEPLTREEFDATAIGDSVTVRFFPGTPNTSPRIKPDDGRSAFGGLARCWGAALGWWAFMTFALWHLYFHGWYHRWLVRRGTVVAAEVVTLEQISGKGSNWWSIRVHYQYDASRFGAIQPVIRTSYYDHEEANVPPPLQVGDWITVLTHPNRPWFHVAYLHSSSVARSP